MQRPSADGHVPQPNGDPHADRGRMPSKCQGISFHLLKPLGKTVQHRNESNHTGHAQDSGLVQVPGITTYIEAGPCLETLLFQRERISPEKGPPAKDSLKDERHPPRKAEEKKRILGHPHEVIAPRPAPPWATHGEEREAMLHICFSLLVLKGI